MMPKQLSRFIWSLETLTAADTNSPASLLKPALTGEFLISIGVNRPKHSLTLLRSFRFFGKLP